MGWWGRLGSGLGWSDFCFWLGFYGLLYFLVLYSRRWWVGRGARLFTGDEPLDCDEGNERMHGARPRAESTQGCLLVWAVLCMNMWCVSCMGILNVSSRQAIAVTAAVREGVGDGGWVGRYLKCTASDSLQVRRPVHAGKR